MQFGAVLAPIAAATIVNAILAWFAWRGTVVERRTGRLLWKIELGAGVYAIILFALAYGLRNSRIDTPLSLCGAVFAGEALGLLIVHMIGQAFVATRGQPWRDRALPAAAALGFVVAVFAGVFGT